MYLHLKSSEVLYDSQGVMENCRGVDIPRMCASLHVRA